MMSDIYQSIDEPVRAEEYTDQGSIPGRIIPKTKNMVLKATLLNAQHY